MSLSPAGASGEALAPDSAQLAELRERLASAPTVRLLGRFGVREVPRPRIDAAGVRSDEWNARRPALVVGANLPPPRAAAAFAWADIDEVQIGGHRTGRGLLIGLFAGVGLAAAELAAASASESEASLGVLGLALTTPVLGAFVGAAIGASRGHWRTVYRSHPEEKP